MTAGFIPQSLKCQQAESPSEFVRMLHSEKSSWLFQFPREAASGITFSKDNNHEDSEKVLPRKTRKDTKKSEILFGDFRIGYPVKKTNTPFLNP
jgi:hypothetical protein